MSGPGFSLTALPRGARPIVRRSLAVLLATSALGVVSAHAADSTWAGATSDWTDSANWTPTTVPDGIATFNGGGSANVDNTNGAVTIGRINFSAGAYTVTVDSNVFIVNGAGVFNNSASAQTFNVNDTLIFNSGATASGGTGAVTYNNFGFINFNSTSTAGTATISNGSVLQFFDTSTAGSATITNNAAMDFFDGASAGTSNITNTATGTLTFNVNASAGTATIGNTGTIQFNGSSTASGSGITNSAIVDFFNSATGGSATMTNNAGGVITFHDTSTAGAAAIGNASGAFVIFQNSSSAGTSNITNGGRVNFVGASTASAATITNSVVGTTTFGVSNGTDTATAGIAHITNNASGTTEFLAATTAGNAVITNNSGAFLQFGTSGGGTDTATAGNATVTNTGTVSFNAQTTAGNAVITTNGGGHVYFFDSSTGGSARFVTNAGGVFEMSGLSAAGMTAGSIEGIGTYLLGSKALTVGSNNLDTTVSGTISGIGGSLTKTGTGTLTLSGTNSYSGATTVNGGTLVVDGDIFTSSLTTVNTGGTLAGSGTVGNTAIAGGTLAPGSTISAFGPLTVVGSLSFTAASTYLIQVSPTNAGLTNVSGTAGLGGAKVSANFLPGSYVERQYTILTATGGLGGTTFNPAVTSNMANLSSTLTYDTNNVYLNVKLAFAPPPGGTLTVNQQNVANALTNYFNTNGSIPAAFASLNAAGLTVVSGELGTGIIQAATKADDLFLNLLLDPSLAGRAGGFAPVGGATGFADEAQAYAEKRPATRSERDAFAMARKAPSLLAAQPANRWSVWGAAYGGAANIGGDPNVVGSHNVTARAWGVAAGADYRVSPDSLLGFALAGGGTNYSLSDNLGRGSSDLFQAGAYGRHNFGPAYIAAALSYGWHDVTTNRTVAIAGVDQLQARFRAETFSGRIEGGYRYATPVVGLTPYAAAQAISVRLPAYAEQAIAGLPQFALNYAAQTTTMTRTELGLRTDKSIAMQDGVLTLRGRAAWSHDYNNDRNITAIFQALPGASFVVNGAKPRPDAALVSAGGEMKWLNGFSLGATFEGEFSGNVTSYAGKGIARYTW